MYTFILVITTAIVAILLWQSSRILLGRYYTKAHRDGVNSTVSHIHRQIKSTGQIELILDGVKLVVVEKKADSTSSPQKVAEK